MQSNEKLTLKFYSDPSHGWLQVPHCLIYELGIQGRISSYSYMDESFVYLEEDVDYAVLFQALKEKGVELQLDERHSDDESPIRDKPRFDEVRMATPSGTLDLTIFVEIDVSDEYGHPKRVQEIFNWQVAPTSVRAEIPQRLRDEFERKGKFGWLVDKRLTSYRVTAVTLHTEDGRYLGFPVPGVF